MIYVLCLLFGMAIGAGIVLMVFLTKERNVLSREKTVSQRERAADQTLKDAQAKAKEISEYREKLKTRQSEFESRAATYDDLSKENLILKTDLRNLDIEFNKLDLDSRARDEFQAELQKRCSQVAQRHLSDTEKWISQGLTANNFAASKQKLLAAIERCRSIGEEVSGDQEAQLINELKKEFELLVRAEVEREEQARIRAQIREEEKLQREIDRELQQLDREKAAIQAALDRVLADATSAHSEQVAALQARLAEAEARAQRAKSMAEQTKAGNVYVISNIGSFGDSVFKVGMTRRLEPLDRIRELGDASVPFPFDIHMMIACKDAPSLENALHRKLHTRRINRSNPRKEFFKVDLDEIVQVVREHHGEIVYKADAEALEYRQSMQMSEADAEYIESVYDAADERDKRDKDMVVED